MTLPLSLLSAVAHPPGRLLGRATRFTEAPGTELTTLRAGDPT